MKIYLKCFIIISVLTVFSDLSSAQRYFNKKIDTNTFKTDTVFKEESIIVTYQNLNTKDELKVSFDATYLNKPNGVCIYRENNGLTVKGRYESGKLSGDWIEKNKFDSVVRKVNYDYNEIYLPKDSLNFEKIEHTNDENHFISSEPDFKMDNVTSYLNKNIFIPAPVRFFYQSNNTIKGYVQFDIISHEKVVNVKCIGTDIPDELESEAKRLAYLTEGLWSYGLSRGIPHDITYIIPLKFYIE